MATYPTTPALAAGTNVTPVNTTNWNTLIDNINAIGTDLVEARGDLAVFPGTPYSAGQATDLDDALQAIRCIIKDITGEATWYTEPVTDLDTINTSLAALGTISTQDASAVNITGGTISGVDIDNLTSLTVTNLTSSNVSITGGTITGIIDMAVVDGGTGTSTGSITPVGNYTITQNSVAVVTSEAASAVVNTLCLKEGKVGVGTVTPGRSLTVAASPTTADVDGLSIINGATELAVEKTGATYSYMGVGANQHIIYFGGADLSIASDGAYNLRFHTNLLERMRIGSDGNVGINETTAATLIEATHTTPYFTFHNSTEEDTDGGRESQIIARGEQSGGEETILGMLEFSHDGAADDEKGKLIIKLNDGNDGTSPSTVATIDSAKQATFEGQVKMKGGTPGLNKVMTDSDGTGLGAWTAVLAGSSVLDWINVINDYNATGNGVDNDTDEIQAAITACPVGGTIYFPKGNYLISDTLVINKRLHLVGDGLASQIFQSVDSKHVFQIGVDVQITYITVENLYLGSAATTAGYACLYLKTVTQSYFKNITVLGGYYGIYIHGCLNNTYQNIVYDTAGICFGAASESEYGIYADRDSGTAISSNSQTFVGCVMSYARTGFAFVETGAQGDFAIYGGGAEGNDNDGIYVSGVSSPWIISGVHCEQSGALHSHVNIVNSHNGSIEDCYMGYFEMHSSGNIRIKNAVTNYFEIDKFSYGIDIKGVEVFNSFDVQSAQTTIQNCPINGATYYGIGGIARAPKNICAGDLESWALGLPAGFQNFGGAAVAQEASIVKFGSSSAQVTVDAGCTIAALQYDLPMDRVKLYPTNYTSATYKWTISAGGTNEYYCEIAAGGDPSIDVCPLYLHLNGSNVAKATIGSLTAGTWNYGANVLDSLGYNTIYVRLADDTDPDTKATNYVQGYHKLVRVTASAYVYKPETNGVNPSLYLWSGTGGTGMTFTVPIDEWTRIISTFYMPVDGAQMAVLFCTKYSGGTPDDTCYWDGLEICFGDGASTVYDDSSD